MILYDHLKKGRKRMKKTIGILLALALAVGLSFLLPGRADAATYSGSCGDEVSWSLNAESGALVIAGSGAMTEYSYTLDPLDRYVTTAPWGSHAALIKSVTVGSGVTNIGSGAFCGCTNLSSVSLGSGVTRIGQGAFYNCMDLGSIALPDAVAGVEWCAFYGCVSLSSFTAGEGLTAVDGYAFADCTALTAVSFPANVKTVGERAFSGRSSELTFAVAAGSFAEEYARENGIRFEVY